MNVYPAPNFGAAGSLTNNYLSDRLGTNNFNQYDIRGDEILTAKDSMFERISSMNNPQFVPGPFAGIADGGAFNAGTTTSISYNAVLSETHVFSPTLINQARLGLNRLEATRTQPNANAAGIPAQYGIQGIPQ